MTNRLLQADLCCTFTGGNGAFFMCSALLWMSYGMLKVDYTVVFVNIIGLLLQCGYLLVYYTYTSNRVSDMYVSVSKLAE